MSSASLHTGITTEGLRRLGFLYNYSDEELRNDWEKLNSCVEYKRGSQFRPGIKLCQHFFPNFFDIKGKNGKSFRDYWEDEIFMNSVLDWGRKSMSRLWLSWIRRAVYLKSGLPNSSFYRPHFAKQIIEMTGKSSGTLFDPCAGWGGRMLGTVAAGWDYIGCEPNKETYKNLVALVDFLGIQDSVLLYNIPAEKYPFDRPVDVVLTSPPYFDLEIYSTEATQSYLHHTDYKTWCTNWLRPLIQRSLSTVVPGGLSSWNVMNFGRYDLVAEVEQAHTGTSFIGSVGFISPLQNIRDIKNKDATLIFAK